VRIECHHSLSQLEPLRDAWDRLAGDCTFRTWTWLSTWWRHYGEAARRPRQLYVLTATGDDGLLAAVLPCYLTRHWIHGRTLRLLGDGEVSSDHAGLLANSVHAEAAADALANHLADAADWDVADFHAVDDDDDATKRLMQALAARDCRLARYATDHVWAISLPGNWEEFLALQSKSHRKQLRQLERRVLDDGRTTWRLVNDAVEFYQGWATLADLHQRRRQSLGEPGCFASPTWSAFHREVAQRLRDEGRLRLSWLELDGAPVAAEYHLAGAQTTFAYQGGVDPQRLDQEPGRLSTIRSIQHAIAEGHARFDFLRGDEPYKAHWRAEPRPSWRWHAAAPRYGANLRRQAWAGARSAARLVRRACGLFG
jgi:CelD/BcsL family acetyltransferase involved in cellulose biosynthesis